MKSDNKTIVLVSPALQEANNGNWQTAHRWSRFLSGHCDIQLTGQWQADAANSTDGGGHVPRLMIALHARRSAASIQAWSRAKPGAPLIVVLTGTDLYRDIHHDAAAKQSLALASRLVVLQSAGLEQLPPDLQAKTSVIYQSAPRLKPATKSTQKFTAVMVGHLRQEKDPLTFMKAAGRDLAPGICFDQIGMALDPSFAEAAQATAGQTPRYRWLGSLPRSTTRQRIKHAHVLVNCSEMEGGAHVILEAVQSGTPVLASRISGNIGMLGEDYAGYFELGNDAQLAALVARCAADAAFLSLLQSQCEKRAELFDSSREKRLVIDLVNSALDSALRPNDLEGN